MAPTRNSGSSSAGNKQKQSSILLKVILLGDGGVGKSCLMNRFIQNRFDTTLFHTIGVEFLNKEVNYQDQGYTIQIWDTAGQERFKSLRTPFYRGSDICVLTFSLDDPASLKNLSTWQQEFLYYADVAKSDDFPFVVLGNKVDLDESQRKVSFEEAKSWCDSNKMPYFETSAKEGTNVEEAFVKGVELWRENDLRFDGKAGLTGQTSGGDGARSRTIIVNSTNSRGEQQKSACCF
ncbi:Ras-related protein Rab-9A [Orchesella cincta]|uniref:small monomeric GTPase n=1 Tax=Orchesella cincta TaxID=48709 RepID=A0A1D2NDN0_ORCCI|nr:Ras-related protein Rab-9A [Orchesella cincta]